MEYEETVLHGEYDGGKTILAKLLSKSIQMPSLVIMTYNHIASYLKGTKQIMRSRIRNYVGVLYCRIHLNPSTLASSRLC